MHCSGPIYELPQVPSDRRRLRDSQRLADLMLLGHLLPGSAPPPLCQGKVGVLSAPVSAVASSDAAAAAAAALPGATAVADAVADSTAAVAAAGNSSETGAAATVATASVAVSGAAATADSGCSGRSATADSGRSGHSGCSANILHSAATATAATAPDSPVASASGHHGALVVAFAGCLGAAAIHSVPAAIHFVPPSHDDRHYAAAQALQVVAHHL
mmetsp:Transcript_109442/g.189347  ORF Transcript_109442/g.189347 Transcript_109442/m.189347 type:complete len:216 (-) Transcript_109442:1254-1901(-)